MTSLRKLAKIEKIGIIDKTGKKIQNWQKIDHIVEN